MTRSKEPRGTAARGLAVDRRRFLGGAAAGAALGLAGMSAVTAAPGGSPRLRSADQASGGKLTFAIWQSPDSLDPAVTGLISAGYIINQMFEPLIWHRPGLKEGEEFFPGLAESWEISDDATTYTFHLRQGVTFHDGTPLTAEAIKVSFDHIVDPNTKSRSAATALGPYDHTEVVDDYTAKIVFKEPNGAFLNTVADGMFSPSSPAALTQYGADYGQHPVGTGAFMFKEWVPDDHVTIVRNPNYAWPSPAFTTQGPPPLDEVVFRIIPDAATRVNALKTGEVDMAENLPPQDVVGFQGDSSFQVLTSNVTGMPYSIMVNVAKAPTDDVKVRQALQYAVNQDEIVEALYQGVYEPSHNIFLPGTTGYDESLDSMYSYDPEKAKALLDEAGWAMDGDTRKKDGVELALNFVNIANFGFDDISLLMQAQFQDVGIKTDISAQSFPAVGDLYNNGEHNLADFFYYSVDPFFMRALYACDQVGVGFNWMHYCNADLDKLVQEGNATGDVAKRQEIYARAAKMVMEDAAVIPIYEQRAVFAAKTGVQNVAFSINGYPYFHDTTTQ